DRRQIAGGDRDHQRTANAGNGEDLREDDDAAEQIADIERNDGDDRQQRVAHDVPHQHRALRQALQPSGTDVVGLQHVERFGAHHAH
ncbi:hypothetical protein FE79_14950, partial [Staphylococcus aureus]